MKSFLYHAKQNASCPVIGLVCWSSRALSMLHRSGPFAYGRVLESLDLSVDCSEVEVNVQ